MLAPVRYDVDQMKVVKAVWLLLPHRSLLILGTLSWLDFLS
jgi:hypothetical protein